MSIVIKAKVDFSWLTLTVLNLNLKKFFLKKYKDVKSWFKKEASKLWRNAGICSCCVGLWANSRTVIKVSNWFRILKRFSFVCRSGFKKSTFFWRISSGNLSQFACYFCRKNLNAKKCAYNISIRATLTVLNPNLVKHNFKKIQRRKKLIKKRSFKIMTKGNDLFILCRIMGKQQNRNKSLKLIQNFKKIFFCM